jgi:hypothetical protein
MSKIFRQIQGWKHIAGLGILSAVIAGIVLVASVATRTAALTQLPIAPTAETAYRGAEACAECHPAEYEAWVGTKHALASSEAPFRDDWAAHGRARSCLKCHTTGYDPQTGQVALEGISCEGCHGPFEPSHPPSVMTVDEEARACGDCHQTTYNEWQLSAHARQGVTCTSCHAVHSQAHTMPNGLLPCAKCHEERYQAFAHATHASVGADCETCHMYRPPASSMTEGRVSTGHTFTIGPEACAHCHRNTIHTRHEIPDLTREVSNLRAELPTGAADRLARLEDEVDQLQHTAARNLYVGLAAGGVVGGAAGFAAAWALIWILEHGRKRG